MSKKLSVSSASHRLVSSLMLIALAIGFMPAQAGVIVTVKGDTAHAVVGLPGILATDMTMVFEQPQNLTPENLNVTARLVSPLDLTLLKRLPNSGLLSLPLTYPVMISVSPRAKSGFSFVNAASVELHTHALIFSLDSLFRVYKAPAGGMFYDITNDVRSGSVRTRGRTGGFSDFLILIDLLPSSEKAADMYEFIDLRLDNAAIAPAARTILETDLAWSRTAFNASNYVQARKRLDIFSTHLKTLAGNGVPNVWRAARDLDNIAGDLIGEAEALRFTLGRLIGN